MQTQTNNPDTGGLVRKWSEAAMPFAPAVAVLCTAVAGLGDYKPINNAYAGLPKAISIGVVVCAVLCFCMRPYYARAKRALLFLPLFFLLILIFPLLTVTLWISDLAVLGSVWSSFEQIGFQAIAILYAVSMAYLFGRKAIDHFFHAMALANGIIILLEIPKYGLMESLQSVLHCVVTFGDAYGFMRSLEIHDITFLFGQLFIYYLLFASLDEPENKIRNRSYAAVCLFFVILGFKRLTFPALLAAIVLAWLLLRLRNAWGLLLVLGGIAVFGSFLYIYLIHSGLLIPFLLGQGINLMGRETYWSIANQYFEFSIFWRGLGYEAVNALSQTWVEEGLVSKAFPLHNDFLKVYLEIGAIGLALWSGIQYVLYPLYWARKHFYNCGVLYFSIFLYMSITYLTDNTAFYYWSSIGLRLIPMAFCYSGLKAVKQAVWQPADANAIAASVHAFEAAQLPDEPSETDD